jgi:Domain of unknown function (DUF4328)/Protein of unknown function (DUF2510)
MTDNRSNPPPAGWFRDPAGSPQLRWWDGSRWTDHTHPYPAAHRGPDPRHSLEEERTIARWARHAVVAYGFVVAITGALMFRLFVPMRELMQDAIANPQAMPSPETMDPFTGTNAGALAGMQLVGLLSWLFLIAFLMWLYRAATAAAHLGLPARRSPGWAVGSWFIPFLNFVWPWQSMRDTLPEGHAARGRIIWAAILFDGGYLLAIIAFLVWFFGVDAALWVGAVSYFGVAAGMLLLRPVVDDVLAAHEDLMQQRANL